MGEFQVPTGLPGYWIGHDKAKMMLNGLGLPVFISVADLSEDALHSRFPKDHRFQWPQEGFNCEPLCHKTQYVKRIRKTRIRFSSWSWDISR